MNIWALQTLFQSNVYDWKVLWSHFKPAEEMWTNTDNTVAEMNLSNNLSLDIGVAHSKMNNKHGFIDKAISKYKILYKQHKTVLKHHGVPGLRLQSIFSATPRSCTIVPGTLTIYLLQPSRTRTTYP